MNTFDIVNKKPKFKNKTEEIIWILRQDLEKKKPSSSYEKFVIPLIRRFFPETIARDLVSVEPMCKPVYGRCKVKYEYT